MKYKFLLFILFASVFISNSYSQIQECGSKHIDLEIPVYEPILQGKAFYNTYPNKDEQFYNNWTKADIYFTNNTVAKNKSLRYNALLDEMLWMRDDDFQVIVLNRKHISRVQFHANNENSQTDFIKIEHKNIQHPNNNDLFVQLLSNSNGKILFLKKHEVVENTNIMKLERNETYYIYKDKQYKRLALNKLSLYKLFEDDKDQIKQIVKDNKLSAKKEYDLIKVIDIYNQK